MREKVLPILISLGLVLTLPQAVLAQEEPEWFLIDAIVAVVGSTPITESQLTQELLPIFQVQGGVPEDSAEIAEIRETVLSRMIDEEVLVQAANADTTITVEAQDVTDAVDETVDQIREQFPTETEFEIELKAAGFENEQNWRDWLSRNQLREMLRSNLISAMRQRGEVRDIQPTHDEMMAYYETTLSRMQERPATLSFRQVVIKPEADSAAFAESMTTADSLVAALRDGADFAEVARNFSEDPGTRELGGDLGFFRRGKMHRDFERVAFRLRPGQISNPVLSPFGIHIIEVLRSDPAEVHARHILIVPRLTTQNNVDARALADSIKTMLENGAPLDSITRLHHDDAEQAVVENIPADGLPPAYGELFEEASEGDVLGPMPLQYGPTFTKYAVIIFEGRRAPGLPTFEDVSDQIRSALSREAGIRRYVESLRANKYIDIKM